MSTQNRALFLGGEESRYVRTDVPDIVYHRSICQSCKVSKWMLPFRKVFPVFVNDGFCVSMIHHGLQQNATENG